VTLPITLLLWELIICRRPSEPFRTFIRRRLPVWLPFLAILFLALWAGWSNPRYAYLARHSLELRPFAENLLSQINVVAYALSLFVWPSRLTFDHDFPLYHSFLEWPTPVSLALLMGLLGIAWLSVKQRPFISLGLLWFFVTLAPTNSVIPRFDLLSERNLYLPSIGLFLAAVSLLDGAAMTILDRLSGRTRQALALLPLLAALLLIAATYNRNRIYADQVTFWLDAVSKSPGKARAHNNAGYAYQLAGDLDRAIDHFRAALSLNPDSDIASENLRQAWELRKSRIGHRGD
jgi:tetratricopeptide (TPR) repeat protein